MMYDVWYMFNACVVWGGRSDYLSEIKKKKSEIKRNVKNTMNVGECERRREF